MEGEGGDKEARVQMRLEIHGLQQDQSIDHNMQLDSWKMESNPWMLNPGSSLGINNTGIAAETTIEKPQYDDVSTSQKFIYDLNLTPEEIMSTSSHPTKPEVSPLHSYL